MKVVNFIILNNCIYKLINLYFFIIIMIDNKVTLTNLDNYIKKVEEEPLNKVKHTKTENDFIENNKINAINIDDSDLVFILYCIIIIEI